MSVYVDSMRAPYRRMIMCHMMADTASELHAMAAKIGVARKWFQAYASTPHYDICLSKRGLALAYGAIQLDRNGLVAKIRELRPKLKEWAST